MLAACLLAATAFPAVAQPSASQTAADRARLESSLEKLASVRGESARVDARIDEIFAELDLIMVEQERALTALNSRARMMYRSGPMSYLEVLLGAETFEEFATRWELLLRMNRRDVEDIRTLEAARIEAQRSSESLMELQAEHARAAEIIEAEVEQAREDLAASEAALREYEARLTEQTRQAAATRAAAAAPAPAPEGTIQRLTGSGAWQTGVASHYGRSFSGRGASGAEIGPYSMIVAHMALPFGTLIEFEYNGRRAVASVQDRGPHTPGRDFDLGPGVVRVLDFRGVHEVGYRIITR
ncbi:MAG: RlpA-like double-psi beta-barrel domain-containing protein [Anaerosomatales bacterium]|nr:RlpA-like double-psi beta-barrel domain-containing protein [Anaerosomatales bacterium]MDT8434601.1 RlpA-like double-psi beta-barrel domain-containing protein [Anaerosomatales bacterium]